VHCEWLAVALSVASLINHDEAADGELVNGCDECLVGNINVLLMVTMADESLETLRAARVEDAVAQPGEQEADTVLAHAIDALHICALALVSLENLTASADNLELMSFTVSMEVPGERLGNKVHFFHLLRRLCDELLGRERANLEAVVRLDVLDVRIGDLAAEEVEIFHLGVVLDIDGRLQRCLVLSLELGLLPVKLGNFLNHSDEEAASVLMMRHHTEALRQLSEDFIVVMATEHRVSDLGSLVLGHGIEVRILIEISQ